MVQQLTEEQRSVRNADTFRLKFEEYHKACISVILVRTREPFRAAQALRDFAFASKEPPLAFKEWSVVTGWATHSKENPEGPTDNDGTNNPIQALETLDAEDSRENFGPGIYVMHYPHLLNMNKAAAFIHYLKHYARTFVAKRKRVALLVPTGYELPPELQDDVKVLDFETPSHAELSAAWDQQVVDTLEPEKRPTLSEEDRNRMLSIGAGMTMQEFVDAASMGVVERPDQLPALDMDRFVEVLHLCKVDVIKKTDVLEMMEPIPLSDIGGLGPLKDWLQVRVASFSDAAREFGIEPPRGITLCGPPGTGKSLVAKATAAALGLPLVRFDVSRIFQSLVGSSEQKVRATLDIVDSMAPCVLFLDELDKVFGGTVAGLQGDSGVGQRVLGSILTWLQEGDKPVFVVATANRSEYLPPEMMRRGRMDEVFSVSTPSEQERMDILRIHITKRGHDPDAVEGLQEAVLASDGYVGAELEAAVKDALIEAWHEGQKHGVQPMLTGALITKQLKELKPLSEAFAEDFQAMEEWAANNARPANTGGKRGQVRTRVRQARAISTQRELAVGGPSHPLGS